MVRARSGARWLPLHDRRPGELPPWMAGRRHSLLATRAGGHRSTRTHRRERARSNRMKSLLGAPVLAVWLTAAAAYAAPEEFAYCTVCHGAEGNGNVAIRAPKIAGLDAAYLTRQLEAFRVGWRGMHADDRQGREMSFVALTLADDSTLARAVAFVGTLEPKTPPRSVAAHSH